MNVGLRGLGGVQARIEEIQGRLKSLQGNDQSSVPFPPLPGPSPAPSLQGQLGSGMIAAADPFSFATVPNGGTGDVRGMAIQAAQNAGIDPKLFLSLVQAESNFNPGAVSGAGAQGLTQLMPGTARMLGVENPLDPAQNLAGGAKYLAQMLKQFDGDVRLALAAYNAGPGAVTRYGGVPPFKETQAYVQKITNLWTTQETAQ